MELGSGLGKETNIFNDSHWLDCYSKGTNSVMYRPGKLKKQEKLWEEILKPDKERK